jgi:sugar (glycoside-pentoside-hexuronide) transporter
VTRTSTTTRLSYAASDAAGQLLFCWVVWYVPYFYTDICKIPAAAVGAILLAARWLDALDAPVWGLIFDRTRSRWGRSRPWFLWLCLPFAVFAILTFLAPDLDHTAKLVYATATYVGCNILYTGINTPVTAILSALTNDPKERVTLTSFRILGSKLGVLLVNLTGIELVRLWGQGDERRGFMLTVPVFAVLAVLLFLVAFRNLRERPTPEPRPQPLRTSLAALRGNWPWLIVVISSFLFWVGFIARITVMPHFLKYVLHRPDLLALANGLDFASLATALLLPWLCRMTSKRNIWALGLLGMVLGQAVVWFGVHHGHAVGLVMAGWTLGFVCSGAAMSMPFSMLSDTVDYGEWKSGQRAAGLLSALGAAFCLKAGAGVGGALSMGLLDAGGYLAGQEQASAALLAIERAVVWIPAICFALALIPLLFYGRFERQEGQIRAALEQRRIQQDVGQALAPASVLRGSEPSQ